MCAAVARHLCDAVHHQHGRGRKLCIAGAKKLASGTFQQTFFVKTCRVICHDAALLLSQFVVVTIGLASGSPLSQGQRLGWGYTRTKGKSANLIKVCV
jgi:hypothetical protein